MATPTRTASIQEQLLLTSDPGTGRLNPDQVPGFGHGVSLMARLGLIYPGYASARSAHLTTEGLAARAQLVLAQSTRKTEVEDMGLLPHGFVHDNGRRDLTPDTPGRAEQVQAAWGVLRGERQRWKNSPTEMIACELENPVWAVSLTLEADGHPPCAIDEYGRYARFGYIVDPAQEKSTARIKTGMPYTWEAIGHPHRMEADELAAHHREVMAAYTATLEGTGWQVTPRRAETPLWYLLATPPA